MTDTELNAIVDWCREKIVYAKSMRRAYGDTFDGYANAMQAVISYLHKLKDGQTICQEKQIELKPCPFCGGEARILVVKKGYKSIIECTTPCCGFMRHSYNNGDTDEHAALRLTTAWNRRVNDEQR